MSSGKVSIEQIGELLGHASAQTTKIYARLAEGNAHAVLVAAQIAEQIERLLQRRG